ncbi:MAG: hypothetical protein ABL949_17155 [Fimbriimonadaceae bacterium]
MKRSSGFVLGLLWLLIADVATAGSYTLVVGKGIEVCEAYLKNLNSFPKHPPMVCDRPLNQKFTDFSKPQWQPLEFWPNRHLLRQAERQHASNLAYTDEEFEKRDPYDKWEANMQARLAERAMTFQTANLDIDQDGTEETVLRFDTAWPCDSTNEFTFSHAGGINHYILTADRQSIDVAKTRLSLLSFAGRPDLVLYKERVFVSGWVGDREFKNGQLHLMSKIYVAPGVPDYKGCEYRYHASGKRR